MGKASEIWKEIKPKVGEMLMAVNDIETQAEKTQEEAYQRGLNDAWEAARKILQMHDLAVFGLGHDGVFESPLNEGQQMTPQEAIEKLKAYEQEQDGLRQNIQTIVDQCGYTLDEIAAVLEKMRGGQDG